MSEAFQFQEWAILELMGHRKLAGLVSEVAIGGASFIRIDVPGVNGQEATQFYNPSAVYCMTPVSEELARRAAQSYQPAPVSRYELPAPIPQTHEAGDPGDPAEDDEDEDYEDEGGGLNPAEEEMR